MTKTELYELLDIESPEDFIYQENVAQYLECEEDIEIKDLVEIFRELEPETTAGIVDDYFEEIMDFVPEGETELYTLMTNIRKNFDGMIKSVDGDEHVANLVYEFEKFRQWYSMDTKAYLTQIGGDREIPSTIRDALFRKRMERLTEDKYYYDFSEANDYDLDEYVVNLSDMFYSTQTEDQEA